MDWSDIVEVIGDLLGSGKKRRWVRILGVVLGLVVVWLFIVYA